MLCPPLPFPFHRTAAPSDPQQRLNIIIESLPDVDTIMSTMPVALRNGVAKCR